MSIIPDDNGAIDLPFKLLIVAIIMAITLPILFLGLQSFDRQSTEDRVKAATSRIFAEARLVYGHEGSSSAVHIDLSGGAFSNIEYLSIGGGLCGDNWASARYKLDFTKEKVVPMEPEIPLTSVKSGEPTPLILHEGEYDLIVVSKSGLDFDCDGNEDHYVELSIEEP